MMYRQPGNRILRNAIRTPDGTILESTFRWDYRGHLDTVNNVYYTVDGVLDYLKRSGGFFEDLTLTEQTPHYILREYVTWGVWNSKKARHDPKAICSLSLSHIHNILTKLDRETIYPQIVDLLENEILYRDRWAKNNILFNEKKEDEL